MDAPQFTLRKRVEAEDMILALDDLDQILTTTCATPLQRHEAMAYVLYRGLQAIREEYAIAFAAHEAHTRRTETRQ